MIKTILFDFDGTIADSVPVIIDIVHNLARKSGDAKLIAKLENIDLESVRNQTILETCRKLGIPFFRIPLIMKKAQGEYRQRITTVKLITGIKDVLTDLKKSGFILGIISSNQKENIERFVQNNKIDVFDYIHTEKTLFGKHKAIKHFLQKYRLKPNEVLYIGDEIRDVEACKKVCVPIVAVTWGFNSQAGLEKYKPDFICDAPAKLCKLIYAQNQN